LYLSRACDRLQEKLLCVLLLLFLPAYGSRPGFLGCGRGRKALQGLEGIVLEVGGLLIGRFSFFHEGNGSTVREMHDNRGPFRMNAPEVLSKKNFLMLV
jgi:hypothetical protein